MNHTKCWHFFAKINKSSIFELGALLCSNTLNKHQNGILGIERARGLHFLQPQRGCQPAMLLGKGEVRAGNIDYGARNGLWRYKLPLSLEGSSFWLNQGTMTISRFFGCGAGNDPDLSRDFFAQLWAADRKIENSKRKRSRKIVKLGKVVYAKHPSFHHPIGRWFLGATVAEEKSYDHGETALKQPPPSQFVSGFLRPASSDEVSLDFDCC